MDNETEPRRFKLPSELSEEERADAERFGLGERHFETERYQRWRRAALKGEHEDLALRARLLREEAQHLRTQAGRRESHAQNLSPDEWLERDAQRRRGETPADFADSSRADEDRQRAHQLA